MFDIMIIGAGAAGITAAITAKRKNDELNIAMIESMPRIGKKILATGNGRCNLSNINTNESIYRNSDFVSYAIRNYGHKEIVSFFNSLGLYTYTDDEGRIYPLSNTAASVLDVMRFECIKLGITIFTDEKVSDISKKDDFFIINGRYRAKKVIITCGGSASPSQGSDGSGFELLKHTGHSIIKPLPALVQLTSDNKIIKSFKGLRIKGKVSVYVNDEEIQQIDGEVLFTDYGLSGIASMDAQRLLCRYLNSEKCSVVIDLATSFSEDDLAEKISAVIKNNPDLKCENILSGFVPKKIGQGLIKCLYIKNDAKAAAIDENTIRRLSHLMKNFRIYVTGSKGFENAQITCGGADVNEFDPETMQSKITEGLYCAGEILDVDAPCGGFNLQWAFSSGMCAGNDAAE